MLAMNTKPSLRGEARYDISAFHPQIINIAFLNPCLGRKGVVVKIVLFSFNYKYNAQNNNKNRGKPCKDKPYITLTLEVYIMKP